LVGDDLNIYRPSFFLIYMKFKNVFIDWDDTLWDIHRNAKECLMDIYKEYGYDKFYQTFDDYYNVYSPTNEHLWGLYRQGLIKKDELIVERFLIPVRQFGINDPEYAKNLSDDFLDRTTRKTGLLDGAKELLEYLKPKYEIHILSNGFREVQYKKIANSGLADYFGKVILSEDVGVNKPHLDYFRYALKSTNSKKTDTIMIGDSWDADIVGAHNSKIASIWLNHSNKPSEGFEPTYTVRSLYEIMQIL